MNIYIYSFIYYEPISNNYYYATIEKTNQINYDTNNIIDEKNYINYKMPFPKMPLLYVGSIDLTNRIYIDTSNNQYIKKLELIKENSYSIYNEIYPLLKPVYPYARHYDGDGGEIYEGIRYKNGEVDFFRSLNIRNKGKLIQTCGG